MAKTSLQKSHSKVSNFKLTILCLLTALFSSAIWAGVAIILLIDSMVTLGIIISSVSLVLTILFIQLLGKFAR